MRQIHIYIRDEENMDNTEITVDSKSVEDSLAHITEIATRFQICAQQRLMIMEAGCYMHFVLSWASAAAVRKKLVCERH